MQGTCKADARKRLDIVHSKVSRAGCWEATAYNACMQEDFVCVTHCKRQNSVDMSKQPILHGQLRLADVTYSIAVGKDLAGFSISLHQDASCLLIQLNQVVQLILTKPEDITPCVSHSMSCNFKAGQPVRLMAQTYILTCCHLTIHHAHQRQIMSAVSVAL